MMFAKPTLYALLALSLMSREYHGRVVKSRELADRLKIHEAYLSKILSRLARKGIVKSHRGPSGGFQFVSEPTSVTLSRILRSCDDTETLEQGCVMGLGACGEDNHCCWHESWSQFRRNALDSIETLTLEDLSGRMLEERFSNHQLEFKRASSLAMHEII